MRYLNAWTSPQRYVQRPADCAVVRRGQSGVVGRRTLGHITTCSQDPTGEPRCGLSGSEARLFAFAFYHHALPMARTDPDGQLRRNASRSWRDRRLNPALACDAVSPSSSRRFRTRLRSWRPCGCCVASHRTRRTTHYCRKVPNAIARLPLSSSERQTVAPWGRCPQSRSAASAGRRALRCRMEPSARPRGGMETALSVCRL